MIATASKEAQKRRSGRLAYILWTIWKVRNGRIFIGTRMTHYEVAMLAFEDIKQSNMAFGGTLATMGIG